MSLAAKSVAAVMPAVKAGVQWANNTAFGSGVIGDINKNAWLNNQWSAQQAADLRSWQEQQNQKAMEFNSAEAAKNRDWQKMMSDTAHQREVQDLMKAGLNPVLSATGGNGAAVTSGATASGVTSAGAKGDVDTTKNSAIVSLLSTILNNKNAMDMANLSAQTNLAVADKYNAMSQLVAQISASASRDVAGISASAQRYASDNARAASQYAADVSSKTSQIVATINRDSNVVSSQVHAQAQRYAANVQAAANRYQTDQTNANRVALQEAQNKFNEYIKKNYPSNVWQAAQFAGSQIGKSELGDIISDINGTSNPFNSAPYK